MPFFFFLAFYLAFSFFTFRDYGLTWDEQDSYLGGEELYQCLLHGMPMHYLDPEHSYPYTFFLSFFAGPTDYGFLHLLNLLFAAILFWAVYEVLLEEYGDGLWALAGPVSLFLLLPFLGSIPANPKDVPFAIFYFLNLAVLYLYERKFPQLRFRWFFLGLTAGMALCSRLVGFALFPVMVLYDAYLFWTAKGKKKSKAVLKWLKGRALPWLGTLVVSQILCLLLWPFIGQDYPRNLEVALWLSAHFPPKYSFLFMGGMADSLTYPWYYLPLWIGITTPLFLLAFFLGSALLYTRARSNHLFTLVVGVFTLNLGLYLFLHPAIYDGLRHFLFLLPLMAVLASMAFIEFFRVKKWGWGRKAVGGLTVLGILLTVADLVQLHPYEYAYFNELAGGFKGAYGRFETDYWAASLKEAVEWLKANEIKDPNRTYKVYADGAPFQSKTFFAPNMDYVSKKDGADYAIIMTRAGFKPDPGEEDKVIHRVEREGAPLSFILKLK